MWRSSDRWRLRWKWLVVVFIALAASGALAVWAQEAFGPWFCKQIPTDLSPGEMSWVSLPAKSPIRSAEELAEWIGPSVVYIERWFPQSSPNRWEPGTSTCTNQAAGTAACATGVNPNPCFCVGPGEGYVVKVAYPTTVQHLGKDSPIQIPLGSVGQSYLISLPLGTTVADAKALMDDIGFSSVAQVSRFLSVTDTVQTYTGRKGTGANFPIEPETAYVVKMNNAVSYVPSTFGPIVGPSCGVQDSDFGIAGGPTSMTFPWELQDAAAAVVCGSLTSPLTAGGDAVTIAEDFVDAITANCPSTVLASKTPTTANFNVHYNGIPGPPALFVGLAGLLPTCAVDGLGCVFNPSIKAVVPFPKDPLRLRLTKSGAADILLYWDDVGEPTLTWNVYRDPDRDPSTWGLPHALGVIDGDAVTIGIQWKDVGALATADSYYYKVTAVNAAGESPLVDPPSP